MLTLILNGFSAPFAMAAMNQAHHRHHHAGRLIDAQDEHTHASAHHGGTTHPAAAAEADTPTVSSPECCDSTSCRCGCVLPCGVSTNMLISGVVRRAGLMPIVFNSGILRPAPTPPFRPPAG
ncbi:MAG: CopL family metal-binding regulatory protein [Xanthomonadaceae bacterium]|nr:CopL family metal-binding regulatory protein [Xanthomonadaceae bacterium]